MLTVLKWSISKKNAWKGTCKTATPLWMKLSWTFPLLWEYLSGELLFFTLLKAADRFFPTGSGPLGCLSLCLSLTLRWQAADLGWSRTLWWVVTNGYEMPKSLSEWQELWNWGDECFSSSDSCALAGFSNYTTKAGKDQRCDNTAVNS